jgi:hypothetical protein
VIPVGPGRYRVTFAGQAARGGVVHVTAISGSPQWCQVDTFWPSGPDELAQIACYKVGGALVPSGNSNFCGLNTLWVHSGPDTIVRDVNCFDNSGVPADTGFFIRDNSAF